MISGPGLENIYQAICNADGINCKELSAAQISVAYGDNPIAKEAVNLFSALLGRIAGNLALGVMAKGGVYVTGGMAHNMLAQLEQGSFRHEFENKWPQNELAITIPTWFVNHENAALEGLANYVRTPERFDLTHACVSIAAA
jgi:glucokinase